MSTTIPLEIMIAQLNYYNHILNTDDIRNDFILKETMIEIIKESIHKYSMIKDSEYIFVFDEKKIIVQLIKI